MAVLLPAMGLLLSASHLAQAAAPASRTEIGWASTYLPLLHGTGQPPSTPPPIYPTASWIVTSPAAQGMDATLLAQARSYAELTFGSGYILRNGYLVMSWGDSSLLYDVKSAGKSIGVSLLGLALMDNRLSLSDPAILYHPGLGNPPSTNLSTGWLDEITIVDLATHTSGFDKPGGYTSLLYPPGTAWYYSDGGVNWLGEALTLIYQQDLLDLLFDRVLTPIGITPGDLTWRSNIYRPTIIDGIENRELDGGMSADIDALARIGYLYLRKGQWNNQTILPPEFIAQASSTAPHLNGIPEFDPANGYNAAHHYGLLWWNNSDLTLPNVPADAYWAWGLGDNLIIVIPSLDIVAVRTSYKGWQSEWVPNYSVIQPFIEPIAQSVID